MLRNLPFASVLVLALALTLPACVTTGPTTVNVTVMVTQTLNLANPVQSNDPTCPAISKIRVTYPESLARGAKAPISATPLDSSAKERDPKCDDADGLVWTVQPSEMATVADVRAFVTDLHAGNKAGSATLSVSVGRSGANTVPFSVQ